MNVEQEFRCPFDRLHIFMSVGVCLCYSVRWVSLVANGETADPIDIKIVDRWSFENEQATAAAWNQNEIWKDKN